MHNPHAYRGRHEPAKVWLEDDSTKRPTDKERIEQLEDEVKRERAACEYWRLLYEGVKK